MIGLSVTTADGATFGLTDEQRGIVEWGDGPAVVIAGAGTGKTRVIIERVRWLLETYGDGALTNTPQGDLLAAEPRDRHRDRPFDGPLLPEQLLVLTYNVKAARELQERLDKRVGPAVRSRMTVSNFHSFCHRVLSEAGGEAGVSGNPSVLDGVGQVLLLRDIQPQLGLVYHNEWQFGQIVQFINRAKDELVTPDDFDAFVAEERRAFEDRYEPFETAFARLERQGNLKPPREVRGAYASLRAHERAEARGEARTYDERMVEKAADREARRTVGGVGRALYRSQIPAEHHPTIDALAATYERDGAALEVLRLTELARVYRAYQGELAARGALDFGEQIAAVTQLFKLRPNILRSWQRRFRYLLVDEFQDANVAQIELIELLGRTPDRPDNVMVVGDDDQSIYRFRGASFAAFAEFDRRFSRPPAHDPAGPPPPAPTRLRLTENFRSVAHVLTAANRTITRNALRYEPDKVLRPTREAGDAVELHVCAGAEDEAVAIVDHIKAVAAGTGEDGRPRWGDVAVLYRKHKHREAIVARLREEEIPYTVVGGLSLFGTPEIRDLEQALRVIANPHEDVALTRVMTAGPWRLDAVELLWLSRMRQIEAAGHLIEIAKRIVETGQVTVDGCTARRWRPRASMPRRSCARSSAGS